MRLSESYCAHTGPQLPFVFHNRQVLSENRSKNNNDKYKTSKYGETPHLYVHSLTGNPEITPVLFCDGNQPGNKFILLRNGSLLYSRLFWTRHFLRLKVRVEQLSFLFKLSKRQNSTISTSQKTRRATRYKHLWSLSSSTPLFGFLEI